MGQDFGQRAEWSEERGLDWWQLEEPGFSSGIARFMADVNGLYRSRPALWSQDTLPQGYPGSMPTTRPTTCSASCASADGSVMACVFNFAGAEHSRYRLGLPQAGTWREVLNSDATVYNGSGIGNLGAVRAVDEPWHGRPASAQLVLPPTARSGSSPPDFPLWREQTQTTPNPRRVAKLCVRSRREKLAPGNQYRALARLRRPTITSGSAASNSSNSSISRVRTRSDRPRW